MSAANPGYAGPWKLSTPVIVADIRLTGQTGVIAQTPVIASPPLGCYRLSLVLGVSFNGTAGVITLSGVSVASGFSIVQSLPGINIANGLGAADDFIFEVNGFFTGISYQVTALPGFTAGFLQYTARVILERLSLQA